MRERKSGRERVGEREMPNHLEKVGRKFDRMTGFKVEPNAVLMNIE